MRLTPRRKNRARGIMCWVILVIVAFVLFPIWLGFGIHRMGK